MVIIAILYALNDISISLETSPGQGGLDIYSTMEKRVREWLVSSGSLPTIQARLRADLYAAIQVACLCIVFVESVVLCGYWLHLPNVDSGASLRPGPPPETQRKERQCQPTNQVRT